MEVSGYRIICPSSGEVFIPKKDTCIDADAWDCDCGMHVEVTLEILKCKCGEKHKIKLLEY